MKKLSISVFALLTGMALQAQVLYNNGATVTISSGAVIQVNGNLTNNTGSITNNGSLTVTGNLINNAALTTPGGSNLSLTGTTAQTLSGTAPVLAKNVVMNNTAGITLATLLRIDGVATFTSGVINATNSSYPVVFTANGTISGTPTNASHVNGYVVKEGTGAFTFPLGNATNYQPVGVNLTANSGGLRAVYLPADAGTAPFGTSGTEAAPLVQYNTNEYWDLAPVGTATGTVTVYYDGYRVTPISTNTADLRVAHKSGGMWLNEGRTIGSTGNNISGSIISNAVSTWSPFTFGAVSPVILPLSWLAVTGSLTAQKQASLQWKAQEQRVQRYEVQRSSDGQNFVAIGTVGSQGSGTHAYTFTEATALAGIAYYRIQQVDLDGRTTYSAIIKLSAATNESSITLYPNPVKDQVQISIPASLLGHTARLVDAQGKTLQTIKAASYVFMLDVHTYPTGIYLLQWDNGTTNKLIKQ